MARVPSKLQVTIPKALDGRLRIFDEATARQEEREHPRSAREVPPPDRGWTREELYARGSAG